MADKSQIDLTETPSFPTDNLYKFLAIGGLVSAVFLFWTFQEQVQKQALEATKLQSEADQLNAEVSVIERDSKRLALEATNLWIEGRSIAAKSNMTTTNSVVTNSTNPQGIHELGNNVKTNLLLSTGKAEQLERRLDELRLKVLLADGKQRLLTTVQRQQNSLFKELVVAVGFALGISSLGFSLWYKKVQIYQDCILQREAEQRAPRIKKKTED